MKDNRIYNDKLGALTWHRVASQEGKVYKNIYDYNMSFYTFISQDFFNIKEVIPQLVRGADEGRN